MLGAVDHLHALVDRTAGLRVVREPDAFHGRNRDDTPRLAADLAGVHDRRLRSVVRPLVVRHLLLPPPHRPVPQVDGNQRVGAGVRARAKRGVVERQNSVRVLPRSTR